jgi:simple sugar transport system substrate-binding protein
VRHLNAFALGIKVANPKARMQVRWIYSWYDPAKAKEAAEALVADGCDALAFTEDSASVVEVGQEHTKAGKPVYTFSHYSPMQQFGPDSCVSGQLVDWGVMYEKIFQDIVNKTWTPDDMWWLAREGAAKLGGAPGVPINPKFVAPLKAKKVRTKDLGSLSVYDLVMKRYDQMVKGGREAFDPFFGPITDNKGKVQIPARLATKDEIMGTPMAYYVDNIVGELPK